MGLSSSSTVSEVTFSQVEGWRVLDRNRTVSLCLNTNTYNVVLSAYQFSKCFIVLKSSNKNEATLAFNNLSHKLHVLANACFVLNVEIVQQLMDVIKKHPTFQCAHVACFLGLSNLLSNSDVALSINEADKETGKTPLHIAVEKEEFDCVQKLLTLNAKLDIPDFRGDRPLHIAARCNDSNILEKIASKGKNLVNETNHDGETALHEACLRGYPKNVEILLKCGANPSLTKSHRQPIHCAVIGGNTSCVEFLIKRDANLINAKEKFTGNSNLHLAKSKEIMHFLVELGCPIEQRNNDKLTPLLLRIQEGDLSSALGLLVLGANASAMDRDGLTALHVAIMQGRMDLVQALIVFGADVNLCSSSGVSPRHEAARSIGKNRDKILYYLHMAGAKRCRQQRQCSEGCSSYGNFNGWPNAKGDDPTNTAKTVLDEFFEKSALNAALSRSEDLYSTEENQRHKPKPGFRVLCLDGGGIRGLVTIKILMAIESITGRPIRKSFDWIGGTSTGGILAMGLLHGKTLNQLMGAYFRLKENVFRGTRPYSSESLEKFLKKELGENTKMTDVRKPRVMLMSVLADRKPAELFIFKNYDTPGIGHHSTVSQLQEFQPLPRPEDQLVWEALRATSAAPTYFRASGRFIDGGLIANNPTLDVLSEIHKFNTANKAAKKHSEVEPLHVVISIGTGKVPLTQSVNNDYTIMFSPQGITDLVDSAMAVINLFDLLIDQSTQSEGQTVSRAAAWCNMIDVPYYRLNPQLSEVITLDCTDDSKLINMLWETQCYLQKNKEKLVQLANLLK